MQTLYFFHDPMCSWCWAYRPTAARLFAELPANLQRQDILGGLAPDTDEPMSAEMRKTIAGYWQRIHDLLGTEFNFDFWDSNEPRRATWPACRAVLAAGLQNAYADMVDAIQRAYYLRALNPSEPEVLEQLAAELGLDAKQFAADLRSREVNDELQNQVNFARRAPINGFPSLALKSGDILRPLQLDYENHEITLRHIRELSEGD